MNRWLTQNETARAHLLKKQKQKTPDLHLFSPDARVTLDLIGGWLAGHARHSSIDWRRSGSKLPIEVNGSIDRGVIHSWRARNRPTARRWCETQQSESPSPIAPMQERSAGQKSERLRGHPHFPEREWSTSCSLLQLPSKLPSSKPSMKVGQRGIKCWPTLVWAYRDTADLCS